MVIILNQILGTLTNLPEASIIKVIYQDVPIKIQQTVPGYLADQNKKIMQQQLFLTLIRFLSVCLYGGSKTPKYLRNGV